MKNLEKTVPTDIFPIAIENSVSYNLNNLNGYLDVLRHGIFDLVRFSGQYDSYYQDKSVKDKVFGKVRNIYENYIVKVDELLADLINCIYSVARDEYEKETKETNEIDKDKVENFEKENLSA